MKYLLGLVVAVLLLVPLARADGIYNFTYGFSNPLASNGPGLAFSLPSSIPVSADYARLAINQGINTYTVILGSDYIEFNCSSPETGCNYLDTYVSQFAIPYNFVYNGIMTFFPGVYPALANFPDGTPILTYAGQVFTIEPALATPEPSTVLLLLLGVCLLCSGFFALRRRMA